MSTFTIFLALIVIVAFLLVVVIMVQNPKGGGLSSSFGGGGQQVGGVKKTNDFLDKSTWTLATLLLVLILLSNVTILDDAPGSTGVFESDADVEMNVPQPVQQPETNNE
ncbi:preprotein translocase subunit SecG [Salegentibacter sp. F188]|uniref:Protein-export membrane protein SecG n=1 Tax=Autumnicola patrickiae TaxID=3075591 RepID=A0ABU3E628_9FLAO|nr:preprotein translocase subunit SecG [Salegentibacter sp. F188]MDT0691434.1 preprotein translocase subunit SecG [Salegentibacter sp. F188]